MPREIEDTKLESVGEFRRRLGRERTPTAAETPDQQAQGASIRRYRPTHRPPMAVMCVLDDGSETGEWIRVRGDRLVVGRCEGDVIIPHDEGISSKHFALVRVLEDAQFCWYIEDLQSTNGTFAGVADSRLKHNGELIIGARRYRFNAAPRGAAAERVPEATERKTTSQWQSVSPTDIDRLTPSLIELTAGGEGKRYALAKEDHLIGSHPQRCSVVIEGDPFVEPCHARIHRDAKGHWRVENQSTANGTWLRIERLPVYKSGRFQAGEQRFTVKVV